jgi:hypothetical protein
MQKEPLSIYSTYYYILMMEFFLFDTREDLQKGTNMVFEHFNLFGLNLHVGKKNRTKSKSEAMYISPNIGEDTQNKLQADNTTEIPIVNGAICMTSKFKHLGGYISNNLKDDFEVNNRIVKSTAQVGALKKSLPSSPN